MGWLLAQLAVQCNLLFTPEVLGKFDNSKFSCVCIASVFIRQLLKAADTLNLLYHFFSRSSKVNFYSN